MLRLAQTIPSVLKVGEGNTWFGRLGGLKRIIFKASKGGRYRRRTSDAGSVEEVLFEEMNFQLYSR